MWLSVRERNIKLLLETVTCMCAVDTSNCIIATETVTCIIATERSTKITVIMYRWHNCNKTSRPA